MPSETDLKALVTRALGVAEAERTMAYRLLDPEPLRTSAVELMQMAPSGAVHSALLSAAWALRLRDRFNIPAIAVAGDLKIAGQWIFRSTSPLPPVREEGRMPTLNWRGHCWVEIDGLICDISIFRAIDSLPANNEARQFMEQNFGTGRGAYVVRAEDLPAALKYRRRQVLTMNQMSGLFEALRFLIEGPIDDSK